MALTVARRSEERVSGAGRRTARCDISKKESLIPNHGKFKQEIRDLHSYETIEEAIIAIHHQIYYYNNKRIHATIKMSPSIVVEKWMI